MKKSTIYLITAISLFALASLSFNFLSANGLSFLYIVMYMAGGVFAILWTSSRATSSNQLPDKPHETASTNTASTKDEGSHEK